MLRIAIAMSLFLATSALEHARQARLDKLSERLIHSKSSWDWPHNLSALSGPDDGWRYIGYNETDVNIYGSRIQYIQANWFTAV